MSEGDNPSVRPRLGRGVALVLLWALVSVAGALLFSLSAGPLGMLYAGVLAAARGAVGLTTIRQVSGSRAAEVVAAYWAVEASGLIFGFVYGTLVGFVQWLILSRYFRPAIAWLFVTCIGAVAAETLLLTSLEGLTLFGGLAWAAIVAPAQWSVLRTVARRPAGLWVFGVALAAVAGEFVGTVVLPAIGATNRIVANVGGALTDALCSAVVLALLLPLLRTRVEAGDGLPEGRDRARQAGLRRWILLGLAIGVLNGTVGTVLTVSLPGGNRPHPLLGLEVGFAFWLVLRSQLPHPGLWPAASVLGALLGAAVGLTAEVWLNLAPGVGAVAVLYAIVGAGIACAQVRLLRIDSRSSVRWVVAGAIGAGAMGVFGATGDAIAPAFGASGFNAVRIVSYLVPPLLSGPLHGVVLFLAYRGLGAAEKPA